MKQGGWAQALRRPPLPTGPASGPEAPLRGRDPSSASHSSQGIGLAGPHPAAGMSFPLPAHHPVLSSTWGGPRCDNTVPQPRGGLGRPHSELVASLPSFQVSCSPRPETSLLDVRSLEPAPLHAQMEVMGRPVPAPQHALQAPSPLPAPQGQQPPESICLPGAQRPGGGSPTASEEEPGRAWPSRTSGQPLTCLAGAEEAL